MHSKIQKKGSRLFLLLSSCLKKTKNEREATLPRINEKVISM